MIYGDYSNYSIKVYKQKFKLTSNRKITNFENYLIYYNNKYYYNQKL